MGKKQIQKNLTIFTSRVKLQFQPSEVLLFGSYARGEGTDYSDVDVVVVAKSFAKIPFEKRLDALYPLTNDLSPDFHVFGYTPKEFKKISPFSSISEAKREGTSLL